MLETMEDANEFVYKMALRRDREDGGILGQEMFILLCEKNPWYAGNQLNHNKEIIVPILEPEDENLLMLLLQETVKWKNLRTEGTARFTTDFSIAFWLEWFYEKGIKIESPAYTWLARAKLPAPQPENKWPWGDYETQNLRWLADAVRQFWSTYDESDKSTAPKNEDIKGWLEKQGASSRTAEAIATIIRAKDVPLGRRPSK